MKNDDASSDGGASSVVPSSVQSDRPVDAIEEGLEEDADDLESDNKGFMDVVFYTIYTLNTSHWLGRSLRLAAFKVAVEFLQLMRIVLTVSFRVLAGIPARLATDSSTAAAEAASIAHILAVEDSGIVQWSKIFQFRLLVIEKGYTAYVIALYIISDLVVANLSYAVAVAWMLKRNKGNNYFTRWLGSVQIFAKMIYTIWFPALLDYLLSPFSCSWMNVSKGGRPYHLDFPEQNCLAMPHVVHMLVAGAVAAVFCAMTLLMALGGCDLDPITRSVLASSDAGATFKILALKICLVIVSSALNGLQRSQVVFMLASAFFVTHNHCWQVPYYNTVVNVVWAGLLASILAMTGLLMQLEFSPPAQLANPTFALSVVWVGALSACCSQTCH
eukprot:GHUV01006515.1.p1 GENE.GHUV01006515.1~~GHUV01006515.1.p1  ORF type:complete len:387 (+),score=111.93 GHUV01006515.1:2529-3689(+)